MKKYVLVEKEDIKEAEELIKRIEDVGIHNMFIDKTDGKLSFVPKTEDDRLNYAINDEFYFILAKSNNKINVYRLYARMNDEHNVNLYLKNIDNKEILIFSPDNDLMVTQLYIKVVPGENNIITNIDYYKVIVKEHECVNIVNDKKFILKDMNKNKKSKLEIQKLKVLDDKTKFYALKEYCYSNIRPYYRNLDKYGCGVEYYDRLMDYCLESNRNRLQNTHTGIFNYILVVAVAFSGLGKNTNEKFRKRMVKDDVFLNSILTKGEIKKVIKSFDGGDIDLKTGLFMMNLIDIDSVLYNKISTIYNKYDKKKVIEKVTKYVERMDYLNYKNEKVRFTDEELFKSTYDRNKDNFPFEKIEEIYNEIKKKRNTPLNCLFCEYCEIMSVKEISYRCAKANNMRIMKSVDIESDMKRMVNKDKSKFCPLLIKK